MKITCIGCGSEVDEFDGHGMVDCQSASRDRREKLQAEVDRLKKADEYTQGLLAGTRAILDACRAETARLSKDRDDANRCIAVLEERVRKEEEVSADLASKNASLRLELEGQRMRESEHVKAMFEELRSEREKNARLPTKDEPP